VRHAHPKHSVTFLTLSLACFARRGVNRQVRSSVDEFFRMRSGRKNSRLLREEVHKPSPVFAPVAYNLRGEAVTEFVSLMPIIH
jgi:hypothetical protein